MIENTKMGIWMDHAIAYLFDMTDNNPEAFTIKAEMRHHEVKENFGLDESLAQNKEQNQLSDFFKRLTEVIQKFDEVVLFGPTDAKTELFNHINAKHLANKTRIVVKQADKMTDNQMMEFIRAHFGII